MWAKNYGWCPTSSRDGPPRPVDGDPALADADPTASRSAGLDSRLDEGGEPTPMTRKMCAIVDAFSSGNLLASRFNDAGYQCVHVQSSQDLPESFLRSFIPSDFEACLDVGEGLESVGLALRDAGVDFVVPGSETGVVLAAELSRLIRSPYSNEYGDCMATRDKFLMHRVAEKAGLPVLQTICANSAEEVLSWWARNELPEIVIKPVMSAGTDEVNVCDSPGGVRETVGRLVESSNALGIGESRVIAQERALGDEYIVDTVSCNAEHYVAAQWKVERGRHNGRPFICESTDLMSGQSPRDLDNASYVRTLLSAFGHRFGPAHCELIWTDSGPVMLEVGFRLHGAGFPGLAAAALSATQVDLTIDAYVDSARFFERTKLPYRQRKHLRILELVAKRDGVLQEEVDRARLTRLDSYYECSLPSCGEEIRRTVDVFTSPGWVAFCHEDPDVVGRDCMELRRMESGDLLVVT